MKRSLLSIPALACIGMLAGCGDPGSTGDGTSSAQPGPAVTAPAPDAASGPQAPDAAAAADATGSTDIDDATATTEERAVLGVLNAINEHEIAAGNQAIEKGVTAEVADYARMMIKEHSENRDKTATFGPDMQNGDAMSQQQKGAAELAKLGKLSGDAYARAYVDAMIKGHTEALAALDGKLIPKATTQAVKDHLTVTREHVANHLERAKTLQN